MTLLGKLSISSIILFFIFLVPCSSLAEEDSISFAGMDIKIGMAKSLVLSEIGKNNRIHAPKDQSDFWTVTHEAGGTYEYIGSVQFANDKVIRVNKSWGSFKDKQAKELVKAFYNLLSNLEAEGKRVAFLRTTSTKQPGFVFEEIDLSFGQKEVQITIEEDKTYGFNIYVNEVLRVLSSK